MSGAVWKLAQAFEGRILLMDGAMGTLIHARALSAQDFGGAQLEGCNEHLNLTRPDVIRAIHEAYLDAGADLISPNTFGCAPYVRAEYGLADRCHEITLAGARLAREAADSRTTAARPRFVPEGMGPGTRTISVTGGVAFDQVLDAYYRQARALIEGRVDAFLLETCQGSARFAVGSGRNDRTTSRSTHYYRSPHQLCGIHRQRRDGCRVFPRPLSEKFWPIESEGELAVLFCFIVLWVATQGSGIWSVDAASGRRAIGVPVTKRRRHG